MPTMNATQAGRIFAQATDPGAVGAGALWADTNANELFRRNDANNAWLEIADENNTMTMANKTLTAPALGTPASGIMTNVTQTPELWTVIEDYEATIAESSHTFTINPVIDFDDDSMLVLVIDGAPTAALAMECRANGISTANYMFDGSRFAAGAETIIGVDNQTEWDIASTTQVGGADFQIIVIFQIAKAGASSLDRCNFKSDAYRVGFYEHVGGGLNVGSQTDFDEILVQTSTSTWAIGTRMTLYRVRRAAA